MWKQFSACSLLPGFHVSPRFEDEPPYAMTRRIFFIFKYTVCRHRDRLDDIHATGGRLPRGVPCNSESLDHSILLSEICSSCLSEQQHRAVVPSEHGDLQGEWDYRKLGGSTGPLVYPAGFLYFYTGLYWLTGKGNVLPAQLIFVILYLVTQVSSQSSAAQVISIL